MTVPPAYGGGGAGDGHAIYTPPDYSATETLTGELWTDAKPVYRKIIDTGALPSSTTKNVAHSITTIETLISLTGVAHNAGGATFIQLGRPTAGAGSQVTINVNATNVTIVTDADLTANAASWVELLYTKV